MANFHIEGNHFHGNAQMFGQYNEYNWSDLEQDVATLKAKLSDGDALKPAVTELESAIKGKEKWSIGQTIAKYAGEFASAAFANLASEGILALIRGF